MASEKRLVLLVVSLQAEDPDEVADFIKKMPLSHPAFTGDIRAIFDSDKAEETLEYLDG